MTMQREATSRQPRGRYLTLFSGAVLGGLGPAIQADASALPEPMRTELKEQIAEMVDSRAKLAQVMNDMIFSFGELGFQEFETSAYLTGLLKENGFEVQAAISDIPTAWMATWGSGEPVIALGSDIDGIPKASQKPGVAYHDPIIAGAPGHGEGHNSGQVVNIIAALVVKELMETHDIQGTIKLWPGVAEEQLATKAFYVRDGYFEGVDAVLFSHVGNGFGTSWGHGGGNGLVSVRYDFHGESAHSARPWGGRSALDAVELMNVGMNYRREHLRLSQRIHSIVVDGGDQPNVVPPYASIWYYLRENDYEHIKGLWEMADKMAEGASLMTNTTWDSTVLGSAWPQHMNKAIAERAFENIRLVGMPQWSEDDIALAKALQAEIGAEPEGLETELPEKLSEPKPLSESTGGGSDDIGDISWQVPTITLRYPANIPGLPGHNWSNAVAMATPIAHKGIVAGAKAQAMTLLDLMTDPELLDAAWDYYDNVQNKEMTYQPLLRSDDVPAIHLNREIMETWRPEMKGYYYDPDRYDTYLEQLGISYPTVRED